jgi:LmbE family N-acetylglucosaminyl deacetylase
MPPEALDRVDLLAIAAHRDDCELTCGGTLARAVQQGHRVGILDLTQGEMGTRGSAEVRAEEAMRAAKILGITLRENLALPDAAIVNDPPTREKLARAIRA